MTDETQPRSEAVKRILEERGGDPFIEAPQTPKETGYVAARMVPNLPQMGFTVQCANGDRHGFFFHNLDNLTLHETDHAQLVSFTHRGKAVTLRGQNLHAVFQGFMDHTLQELNEYDRSNETAPAPDAPIIDRVQVDDLTAPRERQE